MGYVECRRCLMTNKGDSTIYFDKDGYCNYCNKALEIKENVYFPNETGRKKIEELIKYLKDKNKNRKYDCLMGISGGLDSCYLAYLGAVKWGLRIAAIHIDDGFDTEVCKKNIENLCKRCNIDILNITLDSKQYYELLRAYMLAGVPNLAVPQDNVLFGAIYEFARKNKISDFLSGDNYALECILQKGNTHDACDVVNIRDINRRFGRSKIDKLPLMSAWKRMWNQKVMNITEYFPLNYIDYNRDRALSELADFCNFSYYGAKHLENYFTGFLQLYWLPRKFNVDKRTSHYSSMIVSGQMTREQAKEKMLEPVCAEGWLEHALVHVKKKLDLGDAEFEQVMLEKGNSHTDYKTDVLLYECVALLKKIRTGL